MSGGGHDHGLLWSYLVGGIPDLIWQDWINGKIPANLGSHSIKITLPEGWLQIVASQVATVYEVSATIKISGNVISFPRRVQQYTLMDVLNQETERFQIKAKFDPPDGVYPVQTFELEDDLQKYIDQMRSLRLTIGRFRIPRIILNNIFWTPSKSSFEKLVTLTRNFADGKAPDPKTITFLEIEGEDLSKAWEPIWDEHPAIKAARSKQKWGYR